MASKNLSGQIIDESFAILSSLGEGGAGEVYLAEQIGLERKVAIKFLHEHLVSEAEWLERFRREGRILASLLHPNIVRCFAYGLWQNKLPYLVFEYVEGSTLRKLVEASGALSWRYVFKLALDICAALAYAHDAGIIHRDLKPDNIIVSGSQAASEVKILDFGMARITDAGAPAAALTRTGQLVGTANYMSPEQCLGKKPAACSDLYSLGCIMYEAICGALPLSADNSVSVIYKQITEYPQPASSRIKGLPKAVDTVLLKSMAKNPEQRYAHAGQMAEDIASLLAPESEQALATVVISLPDELAQELALRKRLSLKTWQLVVLPLLILAVVLTGIALSDPGPAGIIESYAETLPKQERLQFLESSADFFMKSKRMKAAELLLKEARGELKPEESAITARLMAKLAVCSLSLQQKSAAISRATECLAISYLNGASRNMVDTPVIVQACSVIEEADAPFETQLERALSGILKDSGFDDHYEAKLHANFALQSLPLPDRNSVCIRMSFLIRGLELAYEHNDKASIDHLCQNARKRANRLVSCRETLIYFLDLVEAIKAKNITPNDSGACIQRLAAQTLTSNKAGTEIERAAFASFLLKIDNDEDFQSMPSEGLLSIVQSNAAPVLRCCAASLVSRIYYAKQNWAGAEKMTREAILIGRSLIGLNYTEDKRTIFNLAASTIADVPVDSPLKTELAHLIYAEARSQKVPVNETLLLKIAGALASQNPRAANLQAELKALLLEARQFGRDNIRTESFYLQALVDYIIQLKRAGLTGLYQEAMTILSEDAQQARPGEAGPFYDFMAKELKASNPAEAARYEKLAAQSRTEKVEETLEYHTGKTNLN